MTHAWCSDASRDAAVRAAEDNRDRPLPTLGEAIVLAFGFDKASAKRACDEVKSWPDDVQKDCRFLLGDSLEKGVERLQALVEVWRWGKGLLAARYPDMIPKNVSASSAVDHENKGDGMSGSTWFPASEQPAPAAPFADAAKCSSTVSKTGKPQSGLRTERVTLEITSAHDERLADCIVESIGDSLLHGESVRVVEEPLSDAWAQRLNRLTAERDAAIREREELRSEITTVRNCWGVSRFANDVLKARVAELEAASGGGEGEGRG